MDFMNRGQQSSRAGAPASGSVVSPGAPAAHVPGNNKREKADRPMVSRWWRFASVILLLSTTVLAAAIVAALAFGGGNDQEARYVSKNEYQAVFVNTDASNGGQVYFGHITALTNNYIRITNVFYIQTQNSNGTSSSSSSSNNQYALIKLGCELHGPEDEMVINRGQVFFWENLKSTGQVSQKIADYYKQNPNGQNCTNSSSSSSTSQSNATTQNSATTNDTTASKNSTSSNNSSTGSKQ